MFPGSTTKPPPHTKVGFRFSHSDIEDPNFLTKVVGTFDVYKSGAELATRHINDKTVLTEILPNHTLEMFLLKLYQVTIDYDVILENLATAHKENKLGLAMITG
ncbi:MAG: hypothetical protein V2I33_23025 [Kangiellaceae bacterium]|jgi:hypothetical protein|nr:hypothetical protein [Kangiellaceae bacterium]